jgi:hypothetical protein
MYLLTTKGTVNRYIHEILTNKLNIQAFQDILRDHTEIYTIGKLNMIELHEYTLKIVFDYYIVGNIPVK